MGHLLQYLKYVRGTRRKKIRNTLETVVQLELLALYNRLCILRKSVQKKSSQFFLTRKEHLKLIKPFLDPLLPLLKLAVPSNEGGCNFLDAFERGAPSQLVGKNYFRKVNTAKEILGNKSQCAFYFPFTVIFLCCQECHTVILPD